MCWKTTHVRAKALLSDMPGYSVQVNIITLKVQIL